MRKVLVAALLMSSLLACTRTAPSPSALPREAAAAEVLAAFETYNRAVAEANAESGDIRTIEDCHAFAEAVHSAGSAERTHLSSLTFEDDVQPAVDRFLDASAVSLQVLEEVQQTGTRQACVRRLIDERADDLQAAAARELRRVLGLPPPP